MKLLLVSDLHCDTAAAKNILKRAANVDVLVGAGDFASLRQQLRATIDILKDAPCPAILVPGNNETLDELRQACHDWPNAHVLHGSAITIQNQTFFGIGGGIPVTPFGDWSYDFTEEQARQLLAPCPNNAVLVSHSPPKGAVDVSSTGKSLGSGALRQTIEATHPRLVVCGHIHESAGQQARINNTPIVNAGPAGVEWTL